jgi:magnesium-transporting ATPase (P-type)
MSLKVPADDSAAKVKKIVPQTAPTGSEGLSQTEAEKRLRVEARLLFPGDAVLLKLANVVPADMKLIDGAYPASISRR